MDTIIDLRSDTVTKPSPAMRQAMAAAKVGDDVYGDDPTVNRLQEMTAQLLGFEAALFTASGTQANLIALLAHCQRGDEYIVGQTAHTYRYEGGGAAVLGSIQPQPIEFEPDATLDLEKITAEIKPDDFHFARTRLVCLENTQNGKVLPASYLQDARTFTRQYNLALHLDGARLMNAAAALDVPAKTITASFDSSTLCLSKGLGAPIGSLLCGSKALIQEARKWRKMVGGGMRQAGIPAAVGIYALENNVARLRDDHLRAQHLAEELRHYAREDFMPRPAQTNMVFIDTKSKTAEALAVFLRENGVLINAGKELRLVLHLDIDDSDIARFLALLRQFMQ